MESFTKFLPALTFKRYKGYGGKVAIVGGCFEYTGAPFFASQAVLKLGGDLSHIFCMKSAAVPIKSYAPEQIVHPYLPDPDEHQFVQKAIDDVIKWYNSVDSFVIGPGLGRNSATLEFTEKLIHALTTIEPLKPLVLDGDALFLISQKPDIVKNTKNIILTPNGGEYIRLSKAMNLPSDCDVKELAKSLGVNIFAKGKIDRFTDGNTVKEFTFQGSPRRVGGQGDLTAGAMGLFASYAPNNLFEAAAAVSEIVKKAAVLAFEKHKRSTICSDILNELGNAMPDSWNMIELE